MPGIVGNSWEKFWTRFPENNKKFRIFKRIACYTPPKTLSKHII
jgi:hypothetical protein